MNNADISCVIFWAQTMRILPIHILPQNDSCDAISGSLYDSHVSNVSPDLEERPDLIIVHTGTKDLKSVNSPRSIANETISLAFIVK